MLDAMSVPSHSSSLMLTVLSRSMTPMGMPQAIVHYRKLAYEPGEICEEEIRWDALVGRNLSCYCPKLIASKPCLLQNAYARKLLPRQSPVLDLKKASA